MSLTLAQVTVDFLDLYQYKESTQKSYLSVLSPLLDRYGGQEIDTISPNDIEIYLEALKYLAVSTYRRHRTIIGTLFNYALENGYVLYNPLIHVPFSNTSHQVAHINYFTPEQLDSLDRLLSQQKTLEGHRLQAIVSLLHRTGAKVSEILSLNLEDVDFSRREIRVMGYRNRVRSSFYSEDVSPLLDRYIRNYRHRNHPALFTFSKPKTDEITRLPYAILYRDWKKLLKLSPDLKSCHINDLRHTFALERVGIMPIEQLQILLGHEDIKMTLRYKKVT